MYCTAYKIVLKLTASLDMTRGGLTTGPEDGKESYILSLHKEVSSLGTLFHCPSSPEVRWCYLYCEDLNKACVAQSG